MENRRVNLGIVDAEKLRAMIKTDEDTRFLVCVPWEMRNPTRRDTVQRLCEGCSMTISVVFTNLERVEKFKMTLVCEYCYEALKVIAEELKHEVRDRGYLKDIPDKEVEGNAQSARRE